jgi:phosphoenolpyruvate---glycerone phosphotransferase subunit DhaL
VSFTHDAVRDWMERFAAEVAENRSYLTKLDGAIGDGDHGTNMDRGMKKALERLQGTDGDDIGASLKAVGMALVSSVGGAAGPLYGTFFMQMGQSAAGRSELDLAGFTDAFDAGIQGVVKRGKAEPGDKTMLDALKPALEALRGAGDDDPAAALGRAAQAAQQGMEATVPMVARKGRASYLGERSAGHQDPGATSSHLLLKSAAEAVGATN